MIARDETYAEIMASLRQARDDGAYDGARFSLGRKRRPDPNINVLGDLFEMRCLVYDQAFALAKTAALKEGAQE